MSFEQAGPALASGQPPLAQRALVSGFIIAANVAWFAWMWIQGVSPFAPLGLEDFGALHGPLVVAGEPWRLLSCAFVHVGLIHLAFNMYALTVLGPTVERLFGSAAFFALYVLSALGGSITSVLWRPESSSAGASGAIFGLMGALLAYQLRRRRDVPAWVAKARVRQLLLVIGVNVAIGFSVPMIDNAGHLGGLSIGFASGLALVRAPEESARHSSRRALRSLCVLALIAGSLPFVWWRVRSHPLAGALEAEERARRAFLRDDLEDAETAAREAVERDPTRAVAWMLLAELHARAGDLQRALSDVDRAIDMNPENGHARFLRGWLRFASGDLEKATGDLERAVHLDPESASHRLVHGQALFALGRFEDARRELVRASVAQDEAAEEARAWTWLARVRSGFAPEAAFEPIMSKPSVAGDPWMVALTRIPADERGAAEPLERAARGSARLEARTQLFLGELAYMRNDPTAARKRYERAAQAYMQVPALGAEPLFLNVRLRTLTRF